MPSIYVINTVDGKIDLSSFMFENIRKLFILNGSICFLSCQRAIPRCPNLTHLYLVKVPKEYDVDGIGVDVFISCTLLWS